MKITIEIDNENLITFTIPYNYSYTFGNLGKDLSAIIKRNNSNNNIYFISILDYDSNSNSNNHNIIIPSMKVVPLLIANPNKYNKLKIYQHNAKPQKAPYTSASNNANSFQYQVDSPSSNIAFPKKDYSLYYKEKLYGGDNNNPNTSTSNLNPSSSSHHLKDNHSNKDITSSSNALYSYHQPPPTNKDNIQQQPLLTDYHSSSYSRKTELKPIQDDFTSSSSKHALYSYERSPVHLNHSELDEYYKKGYGKYSTSNIVEHSNNSSSNNNNDLLKNIDSSSSAGNIKIVSSTSNSNKDNYKKFSSEKRSYRPYSTTNIPMSSNMNVQQPQKEQGVINRRRNEQNPLINSDLYIRLSKQQNLKASKTEDNEIAEQQLPPAQPNKYQFQNISSYTPGMTTMNNFDVKANINSTRNTYSTNILQEPLDINMNVNKAYTGYKSTLRENPASLLKPQNIHSHSHLQQYNTGDEDYF